MIATAIIVSVPKLHAVSLIPMCLGGPNPIATNCTRLIVCLACPGRSSGQSPPSPSGEEAKESTEATAQWAVGKRIDQQRNSALDPFGGGWLVVQPNGEVVTPTIPVHCSGPHAAPACMFLCRAQRSNVKNPMPTDCWVHGIHPGRPSPPPGGSLHMKPSQEPGLRGAETSEGPNKRWGKYVPLGRVNRPAPPAPFLLYVSPPPPHSVSPSTPSRWHAARAFFYRLDSSLSPPFGRRRGSLATNPPSLGGVGPPDPGYTGRMFFFKNMRISFFSSHPQVPRVPSRGGGRGDPTQVGWGPARPPPSRLGLRKKPGAALPPFESGGRLPQRLNGPRGSLSGSEPQYSFLSFEDCSDFCLRRLLMPGRGLGGGSPNHQPPWTHQHPPIS